MSLTELHFNFNLVCKRKSCEGFQCFADRFFFFTLSHRLDSMKPNYLFLSLKRCMNRAVVIKDLSRSGLLCV